MRLEPTSGVPSPVAEPRPSGAIAATPTKPRNATMRMVTWTAVRRSARGPRRRRGSPSSSARQRPTTRPVNARPGTSQSPNGMSRITPTQATAATDGRMSDSIGTPGASPRRTAASPRTWRVPTSIAPSRKIATNQTPGGSIRRESPTPTTATRARSTRARRDAGSAVASVGWSMGAASVTRGPAWPRPTPAGPRASACSGPGQARPRRAVPG